jgi:hypothetical protein
VAEPEFIIERENLRELSPEQRHQLMQKLEVKRTVEMKEAIVAYIDVLGFSAKTDYFEIESCLFDFPGGIVHSAKRHPNVRSNVFSDNAFLAATKENVNEFLSSLALLFHRLILNGMIVRGGVALGSYFESITPALEHAPENFRGHLVSGSGIIKSVRNEKDKLGGLLFTDSECAKFIEKMTDSRIIKVKDEMVLEWTKDKEDLMDFLAISLLRIDGFLNLRDKRYDLVVEKLWSNVVCALASDRDGCVRTFLMAMLSTNLFETRRRITICERLKVQSREFEERKKDIRKMLEEEEIRIEECWSLAYTSDSSCPFYRSAAPHSKPS